MSGNAYLVGRVAVQAILVNGPTPATTFSAAEDRAVRTAAVAALGVLGGYARANAPRVPLQFGLHLRPVPVSVPPGFGPLTAQGTDYEAREAPWRDAALAALGHPPGGAGVEALATAGQGGADHSFVLWFTKYELAWMGYRTPPLPAAVLCWPWLNDPARHGSPPLVHRVIAHEIGHIFQAPDEYQGGGAPACRVLTADGTGFGALDFPNFNCEATNPSPQPCLMRNPGYDALCFATRAHWGWVDSDKNGVLDIFQ